MTISLNSAQNTNRRQIFNGLLAACLMALMPWHGYETKGSVYAKLSDALESIFGDLPSAQVLGRAYLAGNTLPKERLRGLTRTLLMEVRLGPDAVRRKIRSLRECDWRFGNVVVVEGCVLARTEADLCVLALGV
jgi:hypothetical protein